MEPFEKIAKVLRTDKDFVRTASERLAAATKVDNILKKIFDEKRSAGIGFALRCGLK